MNKITQKISNFFSKFKRNGFWAFRYPDYTKHENAREMFGGWQVACDISFKDFRLGIEICGYMAGISLGFIELWVSWPSKNK